MSNIKFYSEHDLACGWEIDKIINKINKINKNLQFEWSIVDFIEFHNILKYLEIERFACYISQKTGINDIREFEKRIKQYSGRFVGKYKEHFISLYEFIDFTYSEDFLEIIENYKIYEEISEVVFKELLNKDGIQIFSVLKFKILTLFFDSVVKEKLLTDSRNAETIISKYLKESQLYLPPSLSEREILNIINKYIDSLHVNLNVLRDIVHFPPNRGLNIPDKIKLLARRRAKEEEEKIFSNGVGIETGISISYPKDQEEIVFINRKDTSADIRVSRNWLEENLDYPTLWNNFAYLFEFVDLKFRVTFTSKKSEVGVLEAISNSTGKHLYNTSIYFKYKEILGMTQLISYKKVLGAFGIRLEEMIEWFFLKYLKEEFQIDSFIVKMPSEEASYFEKCRTILPEIDRIFKQFNVLIEEGEIDQELIQMSSSSVKNKDIKSLNEKKYVYPSGEWYEKASYLLFSDQSGIFNVPSKGRKYRNFMELIIKEKVSSNEFKDYQLQRMGWLFDNQLIRENDQGYIEFSNDKIIYILKEFFDEEVLNYWHYPDVLKDVIGDLENQGHVYYESTLLSKNEQDYIDYYLNKAKFTNGLDLRNRYLHGTNSNAEEQYEEDYHLILLLLVIIIIKINDDLWINEIRSSDAR